MRVIHGGGFLRERQKKFITKEEHFSSNKNALP
jgi:hypothetical protein